MTCRRSHATSGDIASVLGRLNRAAGSTRRLSPLAEWNLPMDQFLREQRTVQLPVEQVEDFRNGYAMLVAFAAFVVGAPVESLTPALLLRHLEDAFELSRKHEAFPDDIPGLRGVEP